MISTGLLWYDDDAQRPIAVKIAEAAERYRERVGLEPTTCELSPTQTALATAAKEPPARRTRKALALPAITLRLEANDHLKPNYFLVGVAEGESPRPVRGWTALDTEPERLPTRRAARHTRTAAPKQAAQVKAVLPSDVPTASPEPAPAKPSIRARAKTASHPPGAEPAAQRSVRALAESQTRRQAKPRHARQPEAAMPAQAAADTRRTQRAAKVKLGAPTAQPVAESLRPAVRKTGREPAAHDAPPAPRPRRRAAPMAEPAPPAVPKTAQRARAKPATPRSARTAKPATPVDSAPVPSPVPRARANVRKARSVTAKVLPVADAPKPPARAARAAKSATATSTATPAPIKPPAARRKAAKVAKMTELSEPSAKRRKAAQIGEPAAAVKPTAATRASRAAKSTAAPDVRAIGTSRTARSRAPAPATPVKATKRSDKPAAQQTKAPAAPRGKAAPKATPQRPVPVRPSPRATPRTTPPAARSAHRSASAAAIPTVRAAARRTSRTGRTAARAAEGHTQARLWDTPAAPVENAPSRRTRSA